MKRNEKHSSVFGGLHKKVRKAVQTGPWKNFQSFARCKERQKQGAQVFDAKGVRSGALLSAIAPTHSSRSVVPLSNSALRAGPLPGGKASAYAFDNEGDDTEPLSDFLHGSQLLSPSRCTTATPASADLLEDASCSSSRPGTRHDLRSNDALQAFEQEKEEVGERQFLDIVFREKIKHDYWESYTDLDSGKKVTSDWEDHMRKVQEDLGDEEILDKDLISCFKGFTLKTPREELLSAYARQCRNTFSLPLGPRQRTANQKDNCAAQLATPEMLQYSGWSLGSDRLDMLCETAGPGMQGCRHCNLSGNRIEDRSIPRLCNQLLSSVETLDLSRNALSRQGARHLANGFKTLRVRAPLLELNLEDNRIGEVHEQDASALVEALSAFCPQLRGLSLAKNGLGKVDGCVGKALGQMVATAPSLRVLDVHWNQFGGVGAYQLLTGIYDNGQHDGRLTRVDISWNRLGFVDPSHKSAVPYKVLADILEDHKHLFHLDISYNQLNKEACELLATSIKDNHTLFGIHIAGNEASVDANGFIFPHKIPGSIRPPLVNMDPWSVLHTEHEAEEKQRTVKRCNSSISSGSRNSKASHLRKHGCTQFIETLPGVVSSDSDQHVVPLVETIGNHPLDTLHLRAERCWICDRWKPVHITWTPTVSGPLCDEEVERVDAYLSIDSFRRAMPLKRMPKSSSRSEKWRGHFMLPPHSKASPLLVVFQVNGSFQCSNDMPKRVLAEPIRIKPVDGGVQKHMRLPLFDADGNRIPHACPTPSCICVEPQAHPGLNVTIPGQATNDSSAGKEQCIHLDTANELPAVKFDEPSPTGHVTPLVVTEDLVEHGKLLVLPRAVDLSAAKITKKWTRAVSVWAAWHEESGGHLEKMLDFDLMFTKMGKLAATAAAEKEVKNAILPFYPLLTSAYRILALQGSGHSTFGVTLTTWLGVAHKCDILDDDLTTKDIGNFFVLSNVIDKKHSQSIRVRGDNLNIRYQFVETLIRMALAKYVDTGMVPTAGKAVKCLLEEMKEYLSDYRKDLECFRKSFFVEEMDLVFKSHMTVLRSIYDHYAALHGKPQNMGLWPLQAWYEFLNDCDAFDERFVRRKAPVAFTYGLMWQIDEVSSERHMLMNFVEFLVAIGAVVYMRHFWYDEEFADLVEEFFEEHVLPGMEQKFVGDGEMQVLLHEDTGNPAALSKAALRSAFMTVFKIADEDEDGQLTLREFRNAFRTPKVVSILGGRTCTAEDFGRIFDALDADHNHVLTIDEAMLGFEAFRRLEITSERASAFLSVLCNVAARVGDGRVYRVDFDKLLLRNATQRKLMRLSLDPARVTGYLDDAQLDGQESFTTEELIKEIMKLRSPKIVPKWKIVMKQVFQEADRDVGGTVTKTEWKAIMQWSSIVAKFERCGVSKFIIEHLFGVLDTDGSEDLTEKELMDGVDVLFANGHFHVPDDDDYKTASAHRADRKRHTAAFADGTAGRSGSAVTTQRTSASNTGSTSSRKGSAQAGLSPPAPENVMRSRTEMKLSLKRSLRASSSSQAVSEESAAVEHGNPSNHEGA